jgi:hypothetical protein
MSRWETKKAERNRQSLARLNRALPRIFPSAVLSWVLSPPFVPPTPRLAIDSYRRAHPIRAWLSLRPRWLYFKGYAGPSPRVSLSNPQKSLPRL